MDPAAKRMSPQADGGTPPLGEVMRAARLVPLWESPTAYKPDPTGDSATVWPWSATGPIMKRVGAEVPLSMVERRALSLVRPETASSRDEATVGLINAALQTLLPHERARPHRHSVNALCFVLAGSGAVTIVDGKSYPMARGDLILTPGWCWHEQVTEDGEPTVWVDILDFALHLFLGTDAFEPGPVHGLTPGAPDAAFSVAGLHPCTDAVDPAGTPVFCYPLANTLTALRNAPPGRDGARRVRYVNPSTGRSAMQTLDCTMVELGGERPTRPVVSSASTVCVVVDGCGVSEVGGRTIEWGPNDIFTLPRKNRIVHTSRTSSSRIFMVSDGEVYRRLGLLHEVFED